MRAIPTVIFAFAIAGATLASSAGAQTRNDAARPEAAPDASRATTGQAPSQPSRGQTATGHRQPSAADVPNSAPGVTPFDRDIDRNLQICRGC